MKTNTFFSLFFYYILNVYLICYFKHYFQLFLEMRFNSPNVYTFRFGSACNPDCSICMNSHNSPEFFMLRTLCFAEYTIFHYQYLITNFIIIIHSIFFALVVKICLMLLIVSYLLPGSYVRDVKQHIPSKNCCPWRVFKYRVKGRANGP